MSKLKILVLGGCLYPFATGGVAMQTYSLVIALSNSNPEVSVWGSVPWKTREDVLAGTYPKASNVVGIRTLGESYGFLDTLISHLLLTWRMQRSSFDIMHLMVWPSSRAALILRLGRLRSKKVAFLIPDILPYEAGSYSPNLFRRLAAWLNWRIFLSSTDSIDAIICPSRFIAESLEKFGVNHRKINVLPIGIDLERIESIRAVRTSESPYILCFAPFLPKKGQHRLIQAFARSRARQVVKLVLLGSGTYSSRSSEYQEYCMKLTDKLGIRTVTEFLPQATFPDLIATIRGSLMCVVPSDYEGLSRTALEAMACKKPVIVTENGGPSEYIQNGVNGFLFKPSEISALSDLIDMIATDVELRNRIGEAAFGTAKKFCNCPNS
ncbi:MAG: glycosyltransferase [Nitrososphaerota archaeon]|nr:glycosyltransferase [Nitrososphaerota archaeon]